MCQFRYTLDQYGPTQILYRHRHNRSIWMYDDRLKAESNFIIINQSIYE